MKLAQSGVRIGHAIVILNKGKTQYLLQKAGRREYKFVGECYVHGYMNGEALTKRIPERDFAIR